MRPIWMNMSMKSGLAVRSSENSSITSTSEASGSSAAPAARAFS